MRWASATSLKSVAERAEGAAAGLGDGQFVLVFAEDDLLVEAAGGGFEGQFQRVGAVPLREDDGDDFGGDQPVDAQPRLEFFQQHLDLPTR